MPGIVVHFAHHAIMRYFGMKSVVLCVVRAQVSGFASDLMLQTKRGALKNGPW